MRSVDEAANTIKCPNPECRIKLLFGERLAAAASGLSELEGRVRQLQAWQVGCRATRVRLSSSSSWLRSSSWLQIAVRCRHA